jgi:hypothetical protein
VESGATVRGGVACDISSVLSCDGEVFLWNLMNATWKAGQARIPQYKLIAFIRSPHLRGSILKTNAWVKTRGSAACDAARVVEKRN